MQEIKCPRCGEVFQVDEAGYAAIVKQVRDSEFEREIRERETALRAEKEMAVEIALKHADPEKALDELAAVIGNCCMAAESIPAVFGILTVSGGDTMAAIFNAVNLGNDSAGAAVMTGAIMGAKNGISALDERLRMQLVIPEPFDLDLLSAEMKERAENQ